MGVTNAQSGVRVACSAWHCKTAGRERALPTVAMNSLVLPDYELGDSQVILSPREWIIDAAG